MDSIEKILESLGGQKRIRNSLKNIQEALQNIGDPQKTVKTIVIGGTNGKGTTTLFTSAVLREAGNNVMTYMSPHLEHPNERLLYNLNPISKPKLESLLLKRLPLAKQFDLTYFEILTVVLFDWANELKPDWLILEVGMGGRLDATNVTDPKACIITNIDLDHQAYLGDTKEKILKEKMGILRPKTPIFSAITENTLQQILTQWAQNNDCSLSFSDSTYQSLDRNWMGQNCIIDNIKFKLSNPSITTIYNARLSYHFIKNFFPEIKTEVIQKGFEKSINPGRMEIMQENPLVVLSGDHNEAGVQNLLETIATLPNKHLHILCGFSPDKPYQKMYSSLKTVAKTIFLTQISERKPENSNYFKMGNFYEDPTVAMKELISIAKKEDVVLVTGSLYLVGEVRKSFDKLLNFLA